MNKLEQMIDAAAEKRIQDLIEAAVQKKLEGLMVVQPSAAAPMSDPAPTPIAPAYHIGMQHWPKGTIVRVNMTSMGPPSNTKLGVIWRGIKAHLDTDERNRGVLAGEMELLLNEPRATLASYISRLLQQNHLIAVARKK